MMRRTMTFLLLLVLVLSTFGTALAEGETELPACEGSEVNGTVIAVDEDTGLVTIDPDLAVEGDECTVSLTGDYDHPIVTLLGSYFSEYSIEDLTQALESTQVCAVYDEATDTWSIVEPDEGGECSGDGVEEVTVTGQDVDGNFTAQPDEGEPITLIVEDEDTSDALSEALESLKAEWELNEDGSVADVGDDIAQYHEDGFGFGVIVKVYAIIAELEDSCTGDPEDGEGEPEGGDGEGAPEGGEAEPDPCEATIESLFEALANGTGIGELFQTYGKPSIVGVGHVRNGGSGGDGDGGDGICNARSQGGYANATGKNVNCGTTIPNKDKDKSDKPGEGDPDGDD